VNGETTLVNSEGRNVTQRVMECVDADPQRAGITAVVAALKEDLPPVTQHPSLIIIETPYTNAH